jgi:hypothetical protein
VATDLAVAKAHAAAKAHAVAEAAATVAALMAMEEMKLEIKSLEEMLKIIKNQKINAAVNSITTNIHKAERVSFLP